MSSLAAVYGIVETAHRFGRYRWAELQLFELLGEWARTDDPQVAAMYAAHSHHHAWHAELFAGRIAAIDGLETQEASSPPPEMAPLVEAARAAEGTGTRLTAVYDELLPALAAEYERHLEGTDPRVDGPTARVLTLALRDIADHRSEAAALKEHMR